MKKYKVRLTGMGIEAVAIIPFEIEPTIEEVENQTALYLNENLMKIEDELGQYSYTFECSNPNPDLHVCVRYGVDAVWSFNECRTLPVTGRTAKCGMR